MLFAFNTVLVGYPCWYIIVCNFKCCKGLFCCFNMPTTLSCQWAFKFPTFHSYNDAMNFLLPVSLGTCLRDSLQNISRCGILGFQQHLHCYILPNCSPKWFYQFTLLPVVTSSKTWGYQTLKHWPIWWVHFNLYILDYWWGWTSFVLIGFSWFLYPFPLWIVFFSLKFWLYSGCLLFCQLYAQQISSPTHISVKLIFNFVHGILLSKKLKFSYITPFSAFYVLLKKIFLVLT